MEDYLDACLNLRTTISRFCSTTFFGINARFASNTVLEAGTFQLVVYGSRTLGIRSNEEGSEDECDVWAGEIHLDQSWKGFE